MKNDKARITYLRRNRVKKKVCVRVKQDKGTLAQMVLKLISEYEKKA